MTMKEWNRIFNLILPFFVLFGASLHNLTADFSKQKLYMIVYAR